MKIAFIGLGVMGAPMAVNLLAAGHELSLHRVKEASAHLVAKGGRACGSAAEAAADAEVVILMLPDTPDVADALFGERGVIETLRPGTLVIDMSSIAPLETRAFAAQIVAHGGQYLDAPVSGGEVGAREGTLTIMVGGLEESFERARPLFAVRGATITRVGDSGAGQIAKVANQIIVGLTIQAVAEGLAFAEGAGADPAVVRTALSGGFAASRVLEVHGRRMLDEAYEPGFRIRLHRKDLTLALDAARRLDVFLPNTAQTAQLMTAAIASGLGDRDHSALKAVIDRLSAARRQV